MRVVSTDTDEQFEASLTKFLAPVIMKLRSEHETVRTKVMEMLVHINNRLRSRPLVKVPVGQLIPLCKDSANPTSITVSRLS